jgi:hypothetical protein
MDGRKNNGGPRPNSGPKGHGPQKFVLRKIEEHQEDYWNQIVPLMKKGDKWALSEFTKLLSKTIPNTIAGDPDNPLNFTPIYAGQSNISVPRHSSDPEDIQPEQKD